MILKTIAAYISLSLSIALLLTELAAPCAAQNTTNRVIVINADQPNVWTLERKRGLSDDPKPKSIRGRQASGSCNRHFREHISRTQAT